MVILYATQFKKTLKTNADAVCRMVDGKPQLLKDVFDELSINPYDLSVDLLDCHADSNVYHRYELTFHQNNWIEIFFISFEFAI